MSTFLVVGASGTVGRELSQLLAGAGHTVRRATSRAAGPGQVPLDLVRHTGLREALAGADGAFLLSPPGHLDQDALLDPVVDAAQAEGVRKVVLMSAMGADADPSAPLRRAELHLEASDLAWNIIRPNWFMQNFETFWLHGIRTAQSIELPTGDAKGSFIDARDIASTAFALLTGRDFERRAFDLTGGESLDHHRVAELLSAAIGKPIVYRDVAPEALLPRLVSAGLPADYAGFLLTILHYFKLGYAERVTTSVRDLTGRAPRRFEDYARERREAFL